MRENSNSASLFAKYKEEYEDEIKRNEGKTKFDHKSKKHVPIKPKYRYLAKAVPEVYADLADVAKQRSNFQQGSGSCF